MFLETIKINNGRRINLEGHNLRMNYCRNQHFHEIRNIDLKNEIVVPENHCYGIVKCRVIYGRNIEAIKFEKYNFRNPRKFKLVTSNKINYMYKSADRKNLDDLFDQKETADDIIIVKNGLLTDSYYANIALYKNEKWYTPKEPLFKGTQRAKLIKNGKLIEKEILSIDLYKFEYLKIFNAMTEWGMHEPVRIKTIILKQ